MEVKPNGSPPATLQGLHLFSAAMGPGVSGPSHRFTVGHPDLPHHPLQGPETAKSTEEEVGDGGDGAPGGDMMVG